MWAFPSSDLDGGRGRRIAVDRDGATASFADVIRAWQEDEGFRSQFNDAMARFASPAFRWETPPVTASTAGRPFECVLLDSPGLSRRPDPSAFAAHFPGKGGPDVVAFPNLGRDAILIVPRPVAPPSAYGHLASFVRDAPESQRHALWKMVGAAMARRLDDRPAWLNTAGAGVPWLHVRLDDRPKYYRFGPYAAAS